MTLSNFDSSKIASLLSELESEAIGFVRNCDANAKIESTFKVYMRYSGQGWEIPITLTKEQAIGSDSETFQQLFEQDYAKLFGRPVDGMDVEITVWSVNATTLAPSVDKIAVDKKALETTANAAVIDSERELFDPALGETRTSSVVLRNAIEPGQTVTGPAAITEDETTIIVPSSRNAICRDVEPLDFGGGGTSTGFGANSVFNFCT